MGEEQTKKPFYKKWWVWIIIIIAIVGVTQAGKKNDEQASGGSQSSVVKPLKSKIPGPSGTYKDAEGGLSFTFFLTGKFYSELLGETSFGTWSRSGNTVTITYEDGASDDVDLHAGYITYRGMRLTK